MGKRKELEDGDNAQSDASPHKKHKKHKKHKHKKKHQPEEDDEDAFVEVESVDEPVKPVIKLKIKLGGQSVGGKGSKNKIEDPVLEAPSSPDADSKKTKKSKDNKDDDDTSDEEREWLDALEKGNLDDNGDVRKQKDISLLTARQRSLLHGMKEEALLELPSGYKNTEITEEQLKKRQQRAKKRREQAQEKREKDKKQTLDRLLKKQDAKGKGKGRGARRLLTPGFRYINNQTNIMICVPQGVQLPFQPQPPKGAPTRQLCGVEGCKNVKKYSCSKTGRPLCSLECYKKNLAAANVTPCVAVT